MDTAYHDAAVAGEFKILQEAISEEDWPSPAVRTVSLENQFIFVELRVPGNSKPLSYLARIDMVDYPVQPYRLGFLDPQIPRNEWATANDWDPRYWPFSFFPGLDGSFHIAHQAPHMVFWCRPCTAEYFYFHGNETWKASDWPLWRVVSHLGKAVVGARHPDEWRPLQAQRLHVKARMLGVLLPSSAGVDDA